MKRLYIIIHLQHVTAPLGLVRWFSWVKYIWSIKIVLNGVRCSVVWVYVRYIIYDRSPFISYTVVCVITSLIVIRYGSIDGMAGHDKAGGRSVHMTTRFFQSSAIWRKIPPYTPFHAYNMDFVYFIEAHIYVSK